MAKSVCKEEDGVEIEMWTVRRISCGGLKQSFRQKQMKEVQTERSGVQMLIQTERTGVSALLRAKRRSDVNRR